MNSLNEKTKKRLLNDELNFVFNKKETFEDINNSYLINKNENSNGDIYNFNLNENINENNISLFKDNEKSINNSNITMLKSNVEYEKKCINDMNSKDSNIFFLKLEGNCLDDLRITEKNCDKLSNENNVLKDNNIKIKNIKESKNNKENINMLYIFNNKNESNNNVSDDNKWINSNNNGINNVNNNNKNNDNKNKVNERNGNDSDCNNDVNNSNDGNLIDISNNEEIIQEINEYNDHNDLNYLSKHENEIDNRIKRKINSLKHNEIKKKKKNDVDNILPYTSVNIVNSESSLKEKYNYKSNVDEKKNDEDYGKTNIDIKNDNIIYANEALKKYPRIFATRLPFEANKRDLEKHFSKYGKIIDIYVSKNLSNNKNKGFGFVSFEKQESMDKALQDKLHIICGKEIVVDVASMRDNKSSQLFPLPSDHYLVKNQKNKKNIISKTLNRDINFNKYDIYNKSNNIKIKSKSNDNYLMLRNLNNLNPNYNILNSSNFKIKTAKQIYIPPLAYNINPKYLNSSYSNCSRNIENSYYYNFVNYKNSNNLLLYNDNMYNSKKIPFPYCACDSHYLNQNLITKNIFSQRNNINEKNTSKCTSNLISNVKYNTNSYVRKLPGGDEWNKRGYKLFVTKLNSVTTVDTLRNYFEKFGEIIDIYMPNDICTNRPRGIAFVTFLDCDCVKKILSNKNLKHIIDGKEVVVDLADPETKNKKSFNYL